MNFKNQEILKKAIPPLSKKLGVKKERIWELLENLCKNNLYYVLLEGQYYPKIREEVNKWWKEYKGRFSELGLGKFKNISYPSKLPAQEYQQFFLLVWATKMIMCEKFLKEWKWQPSREFYPLPRKTFWQKIKEFFKF
jgi:hypothetical protein